MNMYIHVQYMYFKNTSVLYLLSFLSPTPLPPSLSLSLLSVAPQVIVFKTPSVLPTSGPVSSMVLLCSRGSKCGMGGAYTAFLH